MSILRAMYSGVSGISAEGQALGVVGDNIANINTVGFKAQRAIFEDILGRTVGSGMRSAGAGARVADVQQLFTQGALVATGVSTDLAVSGDGFFVVRGAVAGVQGEFYTRDGQLRLDGNGNLVTATGLEVQGYASIGGGQLSAALSSLKVPTASLKPNPTTQMTITANLDATAGVMTFDVTQPGTTSNFSTSMTVYDSLGNPHAVDVYFNKTSANNWEYHVVVDGGELTGGTPGTNTEIGSGTLAFNPDGSLQGASVTQAIAANFDGAVQGQAIDIDFGAGFNGVTQFGSPSSVSSQSQDGYGSGDLSGISVDGQGMVMGTYTNGQKIPVGQLAIAKFRSNDGLDRAGQNLWTATDRSGAAVLGTAGSGGRGAISGGAIEQSNVDLAEQFVRMIAHQRAFQADSKTITTADQMLQDLVNLKR